MEMRQAVAQDLQAILDLYHEASDAMIGTPYDCCWRRDIHPSDEFLAYFVDKGDMTIAVADIINDRYVLITLHVDDKTPLSAPLEVVEMGQKRTLRTVGDRWSYLQRHRFGANAQPFYVLLDKDGQPLAPSYGYDEDVQAYIDWLR